MKQRKHCACFSSSSVSLPSFDSASPPASFSLQSSSPTLCPPPPPPRPGRPPSSEPRRLASLGSLLDDQHWHHVVLERRRVQLNLTVDRHTERVQIPAQFSHWDVEQVTAGDTATQTRLKPAVTPRLSFVFSHHTAACRSRPEPGPGETRREEFPWLPGKPALQRPQPDSAGSTR